MKGQKNEPDIYARYVHKSEEMKCTKNSWKLRCIIAYISDVMTIEHKTPALLYSVYTIPLNRNSFPSAGTSTKAAITKHQSENEFNVTSNCAL